MIKLLAGIEINKIVVRMYKCVLIRRTRTHIPTVNVDYTCLQSHINYCFPVIRFTSK